jgi:hypothetical protein
MAKKDARFQIVHKEGGLTSRKVFVDSKTGVNYLFVSEGYAGGLSVMLDRDGKPFVTPIGTSDSTFR